MKAAVLEDVGVLRVRDVETPAAADDSVVVRVRACAICGTDLRIYRHGHHRIQLPQILGHEIAGTIEAVGSAVPGYAQGERVALSPRIACGRCYYCCSGRYTYCQYACSFGYQVPGGFAEYVLVPPDGVRAGVINVIPPSLSFEEASLAEPLACAIRAQRVSGVGNGSVVVVIGAGPVGLLHCRLAQVNGASKVILLERNEARLRQVPGGSADEVVDVNRREAQEAALAATEGRGADVVIVACSTRDAQQQSLALAGLGGRINFFGGLPPGDSQVNLDSNLVHYKELTIQGSHSSSPSENAEALDLLGRGIIKGRDLIGKSFPLESIDDAFLYAERREGLKAVVRP
ncbi:MAG: alcohol dehydrogenase catalytic domain-containing protein [Chloroflexi bacterium]|nr:alcohol dehydrogenase catalytic domain-containing protein [Chloroflexota bacterium]